MMKPVSKIPLWRLLGLASTALFATFNASATTQTSTSTNQDLLLESCFVKGVKTQLQCGKLTVPENWANPTDTTLDINVIVVKSIAATAEQDPLFLLMGGPGQAGSELVGGLIKIFRKVNESRELVLIDQRGTGLSSPLQCEKEGANPYSDVFADFSNGDVQACISSYNVDLSQYNTNNAVLDFDAVRQALGYEQINLYGVSYGSRAAMTYMRDKPQALRSVILDGVVPPQVPVGPMGEQAARSFDILVEQCHNNEKCQAQYPQFRQDYLKVRAQLEQQTITTNIDHPVTDKPVTFNIDTQKFIGTLHSLMYGAGSRQLVPYIVSQMAVSNYKPLAGIIAMGQDKHDNLYSGMHFNILCNEDIPRASEALINESNSNSFSGAHSTQGLMQVCQQWPTFTPPKNFGDMVKSDIPTLLLSGELDPVTPPAWAEIAGEGLSNKKHFVAKKAGHGLVTQTCAATMVDEFLENTKFEDIDDSCLDKRPVSGFLLNNNGNW